MHSEKAEQEIERHLLVVYTVDILPGLSGARLA
jgi:V8-like Glu-specific endopeptidase